MAVRFNGTASNRLTISSGVLDANSAYAICGWLYVSASTGANAVIFNLGSDGNNRDQVRIASSGTAFAAGAAVGGVGGTGGGGQGGGEGQGGGAMAKGVVHAGSP